ncbi:MAG: hypothetical protein COU40_02210 [Candidatus Moranbacteria bacterium CG10_big_fil_rev_8_21_14_0_10_35_21]|nr:MAG: hypothetical protein COU40_02210 [Candidatus Moranbacteria bacterium CG10_big_fil_rev_8_21_14_0_10_35_21]PJA88816.1 MAG: hypothetical protein CO139_01105 [Candidatus Moranbacteria bacterium CG_4_9_14_3_um_filter_36_9]
MEHRAWDVWINYSQLLLVMILDKSKIDIEENIIGNKSDNLIWLEKNGLPTPSFKIVLLSDYFVNYTDVARSLIKEFREGNQKNIDDLFSGLKWDAGKLSNDFLRLQSLFPKSISFRTSASLEDLADYSFAGLYETYLDITFTEENFRTYLEKCFRSIFSPRVFQYIRSNDIKLDALNFSVIVQEMFPAKFSGVAFVRYPLNAKIVFNHGIGKNIVDGSNAHEIEVTDKNKLETPLIIKQNHLEAPFQKMLSQIQKIAYLKGVGQDIEWSISEKDVAILQTRNITQNIFTDTQEEIFDCTNISESYPSVISPLTYSFIQFAYSKVYANFFRLVGVENKKINAKQEKLNNLLGYIKGRVYYKISNWYEMIKILPGYGYNKDFFESMLVPQKKITEIKKQEGGVQLISLARNLPLILKFAHKLVFYKRLNHKFLKEFERKNKHHKKTELQSMNARELCNYYAKLKESFLDDWKVPILNDFRLMIFHGVLKKIVFQNIQEDSQIYLNKLITNFSGHDDLEIIHELNKLSEYIYRKTELTKLFQEQNPRLIYAHLLDSDNIELSKFKAMLDAYIDKFGDRRPDELILESPRISDDPDILITLIKYYSKTNTAIKKPERVNQNINELEKAIKNKHGMVRGHIYSLFAKWIAHYTRLSIRFRELFRIKRAIVYGIARDCFLVLADKFVLAKIIDAKEDIFYLTTNEIMDISNSNNFESDYREIIKKRKETFSQYKQEEDLPQRLKLIGIGKTAQIINDTEVLLAKNEYRGLPTSQGIVRGRAVILKKFDANIDVRDKIVITYQTDPGWSLIFPLIKGIVLEKGNSLSHAAILSRELGIPSVVRVEDVVNRIKDNELIEVDGNKGLIKVIKE